MCAFRKGHGSDQTTERKALDSKQIEENLGSGVFSEYFEQEFCLFAKHGPAGRKFLLCWFVRIDKEVCQNKLLFTEKIVIKDVFDTFLSVPQFNNFQILDLFPVYNETYQSPYLMKPALTSCPRIYIQTIQTSVESDFQDMRMSGNEKIRRVSYSSFRISGL